jgi:hypothetical protein
MVKKILLSSIAVSYLLSQNLIAQEESIDYISNKTSLISENKVKIASHMKSIEEKGHPLNNMLSQKLNPNLEFIVKYGYWNNDTDSSEMLLMINNNSNKVVFLNELFETGKYVNNEIKPGNFSYIILDQNSLSNWVDSASDYEKVKSKKFISTLEKSNSEKNLIITNIEKEKSSLSIENTKLNENLSSYKNENKSNIRLVKNILKKIDFENFQSNLELGEGLNLIDTLVKGKLESFKSLNSNYYNLLGKNQKSNIVLENITSLVGQYEVSNLNSNLNSLNIVKSSLDENHLETNLNSIYTKIENSFSEIDLFKKEHKKLLQEKKDFNQELDKISLILEASVLEIKLLNSYSSKDIVELNPKERIEKLSIELIRLSKKMSLRLKRSYTLIEKLTMVNSDLSSKLNINMDEVLKINKEDMLNLSHDGLLDKSNSKGLINNEGALLVKIAQLEVIISQLKQSLEFETNTNKKLQGTLDTYLSSLNIIKKDFFNLEKKFQESTDTLNKALEKINSYENILRGKNEKVTSLTIENEKKSKAVNSLLSKNTSLVIENSSNKSLIKELKNKNIALNNELNSPKFALKDQRLKEMKNNLFETNTKFNSLVEDYDKIKYVYSINKTENEKNELLIKELKKKIQQQLEAIGNYKLHIKNLTDMM